MAPGILRFPLARRHITALLEVAALVALLLLPVVANAQSLGTYPGANLIMFAKPIIGIIAILAIIVAGVAAFIRPDQIGRMIWIAFIACVVFFVIMNVDRIMNVLQGTGT